MKYYILAVIVTILHSCSTYAQNEGVSINKEWIGSEGEYMDIGDTVCKLSLYSWPRNYYVDYHGATLVFRNSPNRDEWQDNNPSDLYFEVTRLVKDTLYLKKVSNGHSNNYYDHKEKDSLVLVNKQVFDAIPIHFEKLTYSCTGGLMGANFHVAIDSSGNVHVLTRVLPARESVYYKGRLSNADMRRLHNFLQLSALDVFSVPRRGKVMDAATTMFKCYYNGKIAKGYGQISPAYAYNLFMFLHTINDKKWLEEDKEGYKFEVF